MAKDITCANFAHVGADADQTYNTTLYNLDVIISVGYRVKSIAGTRFRQWANHVLKDYMLKGYAVNQRKIATANPLVSTGVEKMILVIRGKQILLDRDLATLYGVETKRINEQVKRNIERFPEDFCFQIDKSEFRELVANCDRFKMLKHSSSRSFAFTEQGVAMLSSVLKSESAIKVNIAIECTTVSCSSTILRIILGRHLKTWARNAKIL